MRTVSSDAGFGQLAYAQGPGSTLEWIDHQARMRWKRQYQEIKRNALAEEDALKQTIECRVFKARILAGTCDSRKGKHSCAPCLKCRMAVKG
ncbi:MAG: hypothetical protein V1736_11770 [Pseudomonadota bacterium]